MLNQQAQIPASSLAFLNSLKANNNRDWFMAHKTGYQEQQAAVEKFADLIITRLNVHDLIETPSGKKSMHRIYRDVRFGTDKTPYSTYWSGSFRRATKWRRGGYYFRISPGGSFLAGGFQGPNPADLKLIREDINFDDRPLRQILNSHTFISTFGSLRGQQLKTTPKGFSADSKAIDLLRYKQFLLVKTFTDDQVLHPAFIDQADEVFKNMRPFFDYMSSVLTTDVNGTEI